MTISRRHQPAAVVNLDDIGQCPMLGRCESCETNEDLAAVTIESPAGVLCMTLCSSCWLARDVPPWTGPAAAARVGQHCDHLGITRDEMMLARAREGFTGRHLWFPLE